MVEEINAFPDERKAAENGNAASASVNAASASVYAASASVNDMREYMTEVQIEKAESRAEGIVEGRAEGIVEGRAEGEDRFATLCTHLIADNRPDDLKRILSDREYREKLFKEYNIE